MNSKKTTLITSILLLAFTVGCNNTKEVDFETSTVQTGARGQIEVRKDNLGNSVVEVDVEKLTLPEELDNSSYYVIWAKDSNGNYENIGVLEIDDNLEGELVSTTTYDQFQVIITAEKDQDPGSPSSQEILKTEMVTAG
jgi:hypothetical protein